MKSSDLFSHPHQSEFTPNEGGSAEPVKNPVFSNTPQRDSSVAMPPSS